MLVRLAVVFDSPLLVLLSGPPLTVILTLVSPVGNTPYCEGVCVLFVLLALVMLPD